MRYRSLGKTGLKVGEVGLGAWAFGGPFQIDGKQCGFSGQDDAESIRVIHAAQDLGVNFIDTADVYGLGHSEQVIGEALQGRRDRWVLATKLGHTPLDTTRFKSAYQKQNMRECLEGSLRRLRTDHIDVYQWHGPADEEYARESFQMMEQFKREGKVRFAGLSIYMRREVEGMLAQGWSLDTLQVEFNLRWTYTRDASVFDMIRRQGWGAIMKSPYHGSLLTGKHSAATRFPADDLRADPTSVAKHFSDPERFRRNLQFVEAVRFLERPGRTLAQVALRYVLDEPAVSVIIPSSRTVEQLRQNASASDVAPITDEERQQLEPIQREYCTGEGW